MRVALNGWFWGQSNTGSGQYLHHLLVSLRRVAPDLDLVLILPPQLSTPDDVPEGVEAVTTSGPGGNLGKVWFEQRTYPQKVAQVGADIAHVPYWGPPLRSPAPLVTSLLDVIPLAIPDYASGTRARLYTALVSASVRGSSHVLTLSHASRLDIIDYLEIPDERITVTYLATDPGFHPRMGAERDPAVREKYHLPDDFILYLGGFDLRKNVNQLLLAYTYVMEAEGMEVPLVIAGREPSQWGTHMFPDLRQYAAELGIAENVQWIGFVPEEEKASLYRLARVFVWPSLYEGFGLPLLEAMACGTPVVANEVSCFPEIAADGAFLTEPGNARTMAGAIIALLEQEPLRHTQINAGLARVTAFSWRKTAQQTLDTYAQVLG